ncbi:MAG: hypothetical protein Marn2KO_24660 [Marinobacter nauticus]
MRQKARIIAKLAAKYRASAFFVNALAEKTANFFPFVNEGYPEYRAPGVEIGFVNKPYRWVEAASCKAWRAIASL